MVSGLTAGSVDAPVGSARAPRTQGPLPGSPLLEDSVLRAPATPTPCTARPVSERSCSFRIEFCFFFRSFLPPPGAAGRLALSSTPSVASELRRLTFPLSGCLGLGPLGPPAPVPPQVVLLGVCSQRLPVGQKLLHPRTFIGFILMNSRSLLTVPIAS